jgi:hypothetical protein
MLVACRRRSTDRKALLRQMFEASAVISAHHRRVATCTVGGCSGCGMHDGIMRNPARVAPNRRRLRLQMLLDCLSAKADDVLRWVEIETDHR